MIVELCYRRSDMPVNKIRVIRCKTMKEAYERFSGIESENPTEKAYIRYFDGWHYRIKRHLKKEAV